MKKATKWLIGIGAAVVAGLVYEHNTTPQAVTFTMMAGTWTRHMPPGSSLTLVGAVGFTPPIMTSGNLVPSASAILGTGAMVYSIPAGGNGVFTSQNLTTGETSTLTVTS